MEKKWLLINDTDHDAAINMARDEVLFRKRITGQYVCPIVRTYSFSYDAATIGVCQQVKKDRGLSSFFEKGNDMTRRITGGGAVYHTDDFTYAVIAHQDDHILFRDLRQSYAIFHRAIKDALEHMGFCPSLHAQKETSFMGTKRCFDSPVHDDVMIGKTKIAGAAQKRAHGCLLHQGSIDLQTLDLSESSDVVFHKMNDAFIAALKTAFTSTFDSISFPEADCAAVEKLAKEKYSQRMWILKH